MTGTPYDARLNAFAEYRAAIDPQRLAVMNRREILEHVDRATARLEAALVSIDVDAGERTAVAPCRFKAGDVVQLKPPGKTRGYVESVFYDRLANKPRWRLRVDKCEISNPTAVWEADACELVTYPDEV